MAPGFFIITCADNSITMQKAHIRQEISNLYVACVLRLFDTAYLNP